MANNNVTYKSTWDFRKADTKYFTHCYHNYPAMMIPQVARRIIESFGPKNDKGLLFDPFCGTGTTLVEGLLSGYKVVGTDINPLAKMIARAKCTIIETKNLIRQITDYHDYFNRFRRFSETTDIPEFKNINYWFKPDTIVQLSHLKDYIKRISDKDVKLFFIIAFSETIRDSSLTKTSEFKLVRKPKRIIDKFNPNVYKIMSEKLNRNIKGLKSFNIACYKIGRKSVFRIYDFDTVKGIPGNLVKKNSVDIVVTSPPYGDSSTTVAYGQFSRLSNQWLGIDDAFKIDKMLMGGTRLKEIPDFEISSLDAALKYIYKRNHNRALEVASFYKDMEKSCENVARTVKHLGFACYVIANRRVQGITLQTDSIIIEFFRRNGFNHLETYQRNIPNKRMPSRNSPTNIPGRVESTMTTENVIIMQKYYAT